MKNIYARRQIQNFLQMLRSELKESKYSGLDYDDEYLLNVIGVMRERVSFIKEIF